MVLQFEISVGEHSIKINNIKYNKSLVKFILETSVALNKAAWLNLMHQSKTFLSIDN